MYQVRALSLTKNDLWSDGLIQKIYLDDTERAQLFCLGVMKGDQWEPLCVQGKIGYAYRSEAYAREISTSQSCPRFTRSIGYQPARKIVIGRAAIGLLHTLWGNLV